ncbi:hypothetical protein BH23CHL5_BH23CHL5_08330 [soil metagenome]
MDSSNGNKQSQRVSLRAADSVDLHLHTIASDGFWTPKALIDRLASDSFKVVAVCDHDTQRSVAESIRLGHDRGIIVIPGVEVTCKWEDRQLHILVYGIHPDNRDSNSQDFRDLLGQIDQELHANALDAKDRFERSGRALPSLEKIQDGRLLWPFHVLSAVIEDKHAPNLKESAELLVTLGGRFSADLPLESVVKAAHQANGLCLVAHPGRADAVGIVTEEDFDRMRAEVPIDGLEAHYRSYTDAQTTQYRRIATDRDMLISCGSDSHGPMKPVDPRKWNAIWCADLLGRFGFDVESGPSEAIAWLPGMDPLVAVEAPDEVGPAILNGSEPEIAAVDAAV